MWYAGLVESLRAKLTQVKTPDELISVRLEPTLTTLEKLVTAHAKALAASDEGRVAQDEKLQQTLEKLVTVHARRGCKAADIAIRLRPP